jgi:hypothetical protein
MRNRRHGPILSMSSLVLGALLGPVVPGNLVAQVRWQDLVITGGLSAEAYRGNLPAVTVSVVDSTKNAAAVVGEFGLQGRLVFFSEQERSLDFLVDAGLRQFVAGGFMVRDYAPREWVGRGDLSFRESLSSLGDLWIEGGFEGRRVEDRPPMPLFIQPGFLSFDGSVQIRFVPVHGAYIDARLLGEWADYATGSLTPQLDLLDRRMLGLESGVTWGPESVFRIHTGFRISEHTNQSTFDRDDPFRRDRTLSLGGIWTRRSSFVAQIGLEGTLNRSNSRRPEYDAISLRVLVSAPLPRQMSLLFYADVTDKRYVAKTQFARLVPGEEADNASVIYLELAKPLYVNLDGAVRFGWNRAETDIGNSYFERYGASLLLRYRPWER